MLILVTMAKKLPHLVTYLVKVLHVDIVLYPTCRGAKPTSLKNQYFIPNVEKVFPLDLTLKNDFSSWHSLWQIT